VAKVVNSRELEELVFDMLKSSEIPSGQLMLLRTYFRTMKASNVYNDDIRQAIL
jgi:hypothetical protein